MAPDVDPRVPANQKKQTDLVTSRQPKTAADRRVRALVLHGTASDTLTEADARRADGPRPLREAKVIGTYKDRPVREGGCAEEARTRIVGDGGSERNPVAMRIYLNGFAQAEKDPEVRRAVKAWSSCMARKGYAYDSPLAHAGACAEGPRHHQGRGLLNLVTGGPGSSQARRVALRVRSGLAARPAGRAAPAAGAAGHTETALLGRRSEMPLPLPDSLRPVLLRHGDNVTDTAVKAFVCPIPAFGSA
ncbi:hypothetical protein [Streptomyces sp. Ag109_G2-15]|uniref:hypothetical protein n=1 Tax=Streptomyces sp. Ag109_G2-15 TaxID=1938850 RepID=UPI000BCBD4E9|nr:hypothetical protein [Streptomyces sp. Ag109_G2-15]SOD85538.1 hypothetical protein SAMN06272765_2968 [Streptomyces sp. Ag109_G2-15]